MTIKKDIAIIGTGVAGMSAAIYLARTKYTFEIFEKSAIGGKLNIINKIENYPGVKDISGFDLAMDFINQLKSLDVSVNNTEILKIEKDNNLFKLYSKKDTYVVKAVIIATGMQIKKLGLANEESFIGKGISYCATCDGFFAKDKTVLLYGNEDRAYLEALFLVGLVKKLYFVHDNNCEITDNFEKLIKYPNVIEICGYKISAYNGVGHLESVTIKKSQKEKTFEVSMVFPLSKEIPNNYLFSGIGLNNKDKFISTDEDCKTSIDGVYAIGDIRKKKLKQVVTAASDGAIAATAVIKYLLSLKKDEQDK
ncbi:MAG TPA: thioredoxin-disulfide reductase [Firmicutes bacterium]|nr:thioredoxin-disulfide reductase [Bacillota bacterium]